LGLAWTWSEPDPPVLAALEEPFHSQGSLVNEEGAGGGKDRCLEVRRKQGRGEQKPRRARADRF
jgi:hypothetical protein